MVAGGFEGIGKPGKDTFSGVVDDRRLTVHDLGGSNHLPAENLTKALQPKAYAEHWSDTAELLDK